MSGWIKLHRQIVEWEWFDEPNTFRLFLYCLLKANHQDKNYRGELIKRGSFVTSLESLSKGTKLSIRNIRTSLSRLESTHELTSKRTRKGTVIQIVNYDNYQEATHEPTRKRQESDKKTTTTKNDKNIKNEKNTTNVVKSESEIKDGFLFWFNKMKLKHKGVEGKFKTLSKTDINNLKQLREVYTVQEFENAYKNMIVSEWVVSNGTDTPQHFLRNENFMKYVNQENKNDKFKAPWQ